MNSRDVKAGATTLIWDMMLGLHWKFIAT